MSGENTGSIGKAKRGELFTQPMITERDVPGPGAYFTISGEASLASPTVQYKRFENYSKLSTSKNGSRRKLETGNSAIES